MAEEAKHCPQHVPRLHHFDAAMALLVMDYLPPPHDILRRALVAGAIPPRGLQCTAGSAGGTHAPDVLGGRLMSAWLSGGWAQAPHHLRSCSSATHRMRTAHRMRTLVCPSRAAWQQDGRACMQSSCHIFFMCLESSQNILVQPSLTFVCGMWAGQVYPKLANHVATFLACTLFRTSLLALDSRVWR